MRARANKSIRVLGTVICLASRARTCIDTMRVRAACYNRSPGLTSDCARSPVKKRDSSHVVHIEVNSVGSGAAGLIHGTFVDDSKNNKHNQFHSEGELILASAGLR